MLRAFIDTNVFIYAFTKHNEENKKHIAVRLLERVANEGQVVLSTQVLNEFVSVATRKSKPSLAHDVIQKYIDFMSSFEVILTDLELIRLAMRRWHLNKINYYDALIVEAALQAKAMVLYSEDLQHGLQVEGMKILNPFLL